MNIDAAFKLFDVRGKYPQEVDERLAFALARALAQIKKPKKVLACCDTRESSPSLKEFLIDGFSTDNVPVVDLGEAPLPMFNFAMTTADYDLGVMVTASHIADDENGFKIMAAGPLPLDEQELVNVKEATRQFQSDPIVVPRLAPEKINLSDRYIDAILKLVGIQKPKLKLALDVTQSAVVTTVMVIFQKLQADFHLVNANHSGNPLLAQNRQDLEKAVVSSQADLGVIWDSDGDRAVFVDRHGKLIPLSFTLGMLAVDALGRLPGRKIAVDVRAGLAVRDLVEQAGGKLEILPAWNEFTKFAMAADPEIAFGGETSGHYVFSDFFRIDDGILAALRFIRLFEQGKIEPQLAQLAKKYFELPEKNFPCSPEKSTAILEKLTNDYRASGYLVSIKDGLTVFAPDWKFNLRQSVTEPYLRLNLEAKSETVAKSIVSQLQKQLE
ncbi:MAG: hypothetical protein M1484_04615 [Patescibacteria group bacterium]|nr:hypothetical protein [Patescibacteria group bacterium]MCL5432339.1 hypothetical protein [Patescibacteria group bacterium]